MTIGETDSVVAGNVVHNKSDRVVDSSEIGCMDKKYMYIYVASSFSTHTQASDQLLNVQN